MRFDETIVNIIFDAGKGTSPVESREGTSGTPYGDLPVPVRPGYEFDGWYLGVKLITAQSVLQGEEDVCLTAHWIRKKGGNRVRSVMWQQKVLAGVLAVAIVFLAVAIAVANRLVAVYHLTDRYYNEAGEEQSDRYTIKRENGVYKMFDRKGNLMETTENGYTASADGVRYEVYVAATSGNQYLLNTSTGEYETYAIVDYDENIGESLGGTVKNKRVMMFPRVGQDNTYSIEVTNQYGSYKFYRKTVPNTKENATTKYTTAVYIEGTEDTLATYDPTLFASLCVSCGYTLTMQKLDLTAAEAPRKADGSINLDAYGLENRYDENGDLTYAPAVYTIVKAKYAADGSCSASDVSYTVKVGDAILSGAGYYVQLDGRDAVYITSSTIADTVLQPVEAMVTPAIIYPMTVSTYVMVYDFRLGTVEKFMGATDDDFKQDGNVKLITAFNFVSLEEREDTMYSSTPYQHSTNLMKGYQFNGDSVTTVLGNLYQMEFVGCKVLNPTDGKDQDGNDIPGVENDFAKYHLDDNVFILSFRYDPDIAKGGSDEKYWVDNILVISQKTENGTYFVYSFLYDMIVEVDQYYLSFLEWEESKWYNQYFFQNNIANVKRLSITIEGETYDFEFDNRFSYAFYDNGDGTGTVLDLTIRDKNYYNNTTKVESPIAYSKGTLSQDAAGNYIFTENNGKTHEVQFVDFENGTFLKEDGKTIYKSPSGVKVEITPGTTNLRVVCPQYTDENGGHVLDYTVKVTTTTDSNTLNVRYYSALTNFRRLYQKLLWFSIEGDVKAKELGSDVATYVASHTPTMEIRYSIEDMASITNPDNYEKNNTMDMVIRLYQYTERKMLLTIEALSGPDAVPDPTKAEGSFYVLSSPMEDIAGYLQDLMQGVMIPSST